MNKVLPSGLIYLQLDAIINTFSSASLWLCIEHVDNPNNYVDVKVPWSGTYRADNLSLDAVYMAPLAGLHMVRCI